MVPHFFAVDGDIGYVGGVCGFKGLSGLGVIELIDAVPNCGWGICHYQEPWFEFEAQKVVAFYMDKFFIKVKIFADTKDVINQIHKDSLTHID